MSWIIDDSVIEKSNGKKEWWTDEYRPGDIVPQSGIYRCLGCHREIAANRSDPFPPQNHHQHDSKQGEIRWKLNVRTNPNGE